MEIILAGWEFVLNVLSTYIWQPINLIVFLDRAAKYVSGLNSLILRNRKMSILRRSYVITRLLSTAVLVRSDTTLLK